MCALVTCSAISSTLAWFIAKDRIDTTSRIGGEVLSGYFHSGDGSSANPFTITTPLHYENMIRLHNEFDSFAEAGFNFQFGSTDLNLATDPETPKFYKVNSDGTVNYNEYTEVLDLGGQSYTPLGTEEKPFIGKLNGNNLTVSHFNVDGNGYHDIGIFGFVGEAEANTGASISNVYFDNFKINTNGATKTDKHEDVVNRVHNENAHVGYLAGHVVWSKNITNAYVNNCSMDGTGSRDRTIDAYGYYGKVEHSNDGGENKDRGDYSFTLDSSDVYSYFANNYQNIKNLPLHVSGTNYDNFINVENPVSGGTSIYPFSSSTNYYPADWGQGKLRSTYNLVGDSIQSYASGGYSGYNYSLSTMGYQPVKDSSKGYEFDLALADGQGDIPLDESIKKTSVTYEQAQATVTNATNFNYNNNQAYLYHVKADNSKTCSTTFNLSVADTTGNNKLSSSNIFAVSEIDQDKIGISGHFFVDGSEVVTIPRSAFDSFSVISVRQSLTRGHVEIQYKMNTSGDNYNYWNPTLSLTKGTHHYSFMISVWTYNNSEPGHNSYNAQSIEYVDSHTKVHLTGKTLTISNDDIAAGSREAVPVSASSREWVSGSTQNPTTKWSSEDNPSTPVPYIYPECYQKELYVWHDYVDEATGEVVREKVKMNGNNKLGINFSGFEYKIVKYQYEEIDSETGQSTIKTAQKWVTYFNPGLEPEGNPIYVADDEQLTHAEAKKTDPTVKGYNKQNIDIVGGGVRFSNTYITIEPERSDRRCVVPASSSIVAYQGTTPMNTWYATQYASNSIVMYISNTRSKNELDIMGNIEIQYSWSTSLFSGSTLGFKHGNNEFTYANNSFKLVDGDYSDNWSGLNHDVKIVLRRGLLKKAAYCALDKDGKILCGYDANGNQVGYTGEINENDIETYVVLVGVHTSYSNLDTHIVKIDFNYVAPEGYGGDFGSVEYRSANSTAKNTIFNFYFDCPENDKYRFKVIFKGTAYYIYINYYASSSGQEALDVSCYLYDINSYKVYLNVDSQTDPQPDETKRICSNGIENLQIQSTSFD